MPIRVNKDDFEAEVLNSELAVLVDFYSDSCIPCKRMSPILAELEEEYSEKLKVVKININYEKELVSTYDVKVSPTLVFFKEGVEKERIRGAAKKTEIAEIIHKLS